MPRKPVRATSFQMFDCGDPSCGIHLMGYVDDEEVCEIVMPQQAAREFICEIQALLYDKATQRN